MADIRALVLPGSGSPQRQQDADRVIVGSGAGTATGPLDLFAASGTINVRDHAVLAAGKSLTCAAGSGSFDFSAGTGVFSTPSGAHTLAGHVTLAANKNLSAAAGTGAFDFSAATGTFKTSTGAVTLSGHATLAAGKNFTAASGAGAFDFSVATGIFKTSTGAVTIGGGSATVGITSTAGAITITAGDSSSWSTTAGALSIDGFTGVLLRAGAVTHLFLNAGSMTIQPGATLNTSGTGNINLPNNGSAAFNIQGTAVGAAVTAAALTTLTDGSDASALHIHSGVAQVLVAVDSATVIVQGDLLWLDTDDAKPASAFAWNSDLATTQGNFVNAFLGIALANHTGGSGAVTNFPVDISPLSLYAYPCTSQTHEIGGTLGPAKDTGNALLANKLDNTVAGSSCSRVARRDASAAATVLVRFQSAYWGINDATKQ